MRLSSLFVLLLFTCGCAQTTLHISPEAFSQEKMAHCASMGTMYLDSTARSGSHNCDDSPTTCCASGYHLCTTNEIIGAGREIEDSGTGRDATAYNVAGWVDGMDDSSTADCTGWSNAASGGGTRCTYTTSWSCSVSNACSSSAQVWCCSS